MRKVLIVEDNELNLKLFYDLLIIKECEIIVSQDGNDIPNIVKKEKPDLVLMDIQLGNNVSGIDIIKTLKQDNDTKTVPIIAITAFAMKGDESLITESGCDMYVSKPVAINKFFEAVDFFLKPKEQV